MGRFVGVCGRMVAAVRRWLAVVGLLGLSVSGGCATVEETWRMLPYYVVTSPLQVAALPLVLWKNTVGKSGCDHPDRTLCTPDVLLNISRARANDAFVQKVETDPEVSWTEIMTFPARPRRGWTMLHYVAAWGKDPELVELAISKGADVHARDRYFAWMPLHLAAVNANVNIAAVLIAQGADIEARDANGHTPFMVAARWLSSADMLKTLAGKGADVDAVDFNGNTALHLAAAYGKSADVIAYLIESGADVNARNHDGDTPFHRSMEDHLGNRGSYERDRVEKMWFALLKGGADAAITNRVGKTALSVVMDSPRSGVYYFFGADENFGEKNENIGEIFGEKCETGEGVCFGVNWKTATIKDVQGINVSRFDTRLKTPLHYAVVYGASYAVVKYLVDNGADVNRRNAYNTPLEIARASGNGEALRAMEPYRARNCGLYSNEKNYRDGSECFGVKWASASVADARRVNLRWVDEEGRTPMDYASARGSSEVVLAMITRGANIHHRNNFNYYEEGYTPLHYAAYFENYEVVSVLLAHGANSRAKGANYDTDSYGVTPLDTATWGDKSDGRDAVIRLLMEAAPDVVYARDKSGGTPLHSIRLHSDVITRLTAIAGVGVLNLRDNRGNSALYYIKKGGHGKWIAERGYDRVKPPDEFLLLDGKRERGEFGLSSLI